MTCLALLTLAGCDRPTSTPSPAEVEANNRGVALMGNFNYDEAFNVFDSIVSEHPELTEVAINREIARLNRQQEQDDVTALIALEVIADRTGNQRATYLAGLLYMYLGEPSKAKTNFEIVAEFDPADAYAAYYLAQVKMQEGNYEEALNGFEHAMELDPYLRSALYGASQSARRTGDTERSNELLEQFQRLEDNPRATLAEIKYTRMGPKAMAMVIGDEEASRPRPVPAGSILAPVEVVSSAVQFEEDASITAVDIDLDGDVDVFATGASPASSGALFLNTGGSLSRSPGHPLEQVEGLRTVLWGDVDDDGTVDAYLCRNGVNELWLQSTEGTWARAEDSVVGGASLDTVDGALFDADHDGDLDIFCVNSDGPNELINNNRDGSYRVLAAESGLAGNGDASRQVLVADLDRDRDVDLVVLNDEPPHEVYLNDRLWSWHAAGPGFDNFRAADIDAAVAGDIDADGRLSICTTSSDATRWWSELEGTWTPGPPLAGMKGGAGSRLALADMTGDGRLDIVSSGDEGWLMLKGSLAWAPVLLEPGKGPAIVDIVNDGLRVHGAGEGRYPFATMTFSGRTDTGGSMRSNGSGIGTHVAARVGSRWTITGTLRADSGPGQSLQPISVGLGPAEKIDFIAIDWSDGVFQTELDLDAESLHAIVETQRQLSSCPVIFAWNGTSTNFISDCLGVGGVGFRTGRDTVATSRPWERFLLPEGSIEPRNGAYELILAEPMEETCYLDAASLVTWDLPPGWSMAVDERMGTGLPTPTGAPFFYRRSIDPVRVHAAGKDVTIEILHAEGTPVDPGELDGRFIGRVVDPHVVVIEFEEPIASGGQSPFLLVDGWVEYPYSQTMFAAWQADAGYDPPSLLAEDHAGRWHMILPKVGYPAGMPRQMVIPLEGLPASCRRLKLSTQLQVYWDRVQLAWREPCPEARRTVNPLQSAVVLDAGFPARTTGDWFKPAYDWSRRAPLWDTRSHPGYYTRFGEASELVLEADRSVAIFGTGEALRLRYVPEPVALMEEWTRRHILDLHGWCKDMDMATAGGEKVLPLPGGDDGTGLNGRYNTRYRSGW
ncbi:MAG: FG-GAP-like repeat-containing protein [Planctomycetota bacterium]|nr:FG-GAP-like repeat-containing protein [Planctomycetota bacterium]